ncbi:MAG: hypothetical protein CTY12_00330 [Methylotenera sp.]|nr:MAG: hypothetical protein CTY12_00330 [Methylotenera sp.]
MQVTNKEMDFIQRVIKTATLVGIENIIIEPGKIRAMDEAQTVVLFQNNNIPDLSFGSIGINRINTFNDRVDLAKNGDNFKVEATTSGDNPTMGFDRWDPNTDDRQPMWVRSLLFTSKGMKIEYRCASPKTIKAPKQSAGTIQFSIDVNPEMLEMIRKGKSAMKSKFVNIVGNSEGASIEISDDSSDVLTYHFTDFINTTGPEPDFSYKYEIDQLVPVLKTNPVGTIAITARGTLIFDVNGIDICLMARG